MHSLSRNAVLVLIGVSLVLHDTEEYFTFPALFPFLKPIAALAAHAGSITKHTAPSFRAADGHGSAISGSCMGRTTSRQSPVGSGTLPGVGSTGECGLAHAGRGGQSRLCSGSDNCGPDQPAIRYLRAAKSSQGAVDWMASGMANDRTSGGSAYRCRGQLTRMSIVFCAGGG